MKYFKKTFSISFVHLGIDEVYDLGCGLDEVVYLQLKFSSFANTCIMYIKFRKDVNILKHPLWYFSQSPLVRIVIAETEFLIRNVITIQISLNVP